MELFINFADITQSDFILMLIKLAAYILPFFLIPAAFKVGMGAFSTLTGMLSDRSRGFFDKQRKKRQGVYDYNKNRLSTGQRFNNRGLNALTSRASTTRFGLTGKGRMAYQQKINNAGNEFGKSAQAQGVQHNDDALAAMTYVSAVQARSMLTKSIDEGGFGFGEQQAADAIAAAKASGGFGRDRQVWAAAQLARTGTGYKDLEQVSKTIARVSNGNTSQAAALAGDINASTKSVGRGDLAPGFANLHGLAVAEMTGRSTYKDESGQTQEIDFANRATREQAYHKAGVSATGSQDAMTLLRGKTPGVANILKSLRTEIDTNPGNDAARSTVNDLINSLSYGPQPNQQELITMFSDHPDYRDQIESALTMQKQGRMGYDPNRDDRINPPGTP